jgi:ribonucleoside-diphosphate reductase alpha chain
MNASLQVQKRDGRFENYQTEKLHSSFQKITQNKIDSDKQNLLISKVEKLLFDNISTAQIIEALILTTSSWIEKDPIFDQITAQLLLRKIYREVLGEKFNLENFPQLCRKTWIENLPEIVKEKNADPRLLDFNLERLSQELVFERDNLFNYQGLKILYGRYFWRKEKGVLEVPQTFWMRIAMGLALNEKNKEEKAIEFYHLMSTLRFVPSTPTLFHAGLKNPQLSSCFLTTVQDSLDSVSKTNWDTCKLLKYSGGVANDWSNLRAINAPVKSINVKASGLIPPLKIMNNNVLFVSGQKRGAVVAYLEVWHLEIEDFIDLRRNIGGDERRKTRDLNLAAWIPDLFMFRVREAEKLGPEMKNWTLFSPDETPDLHHLYGSKFVEHYLHYEQEALAGKIKLTKRINAFELWKKLTTRLFETGYPWITFKDACNISSPQSHVGVVHCSNLCTEITLNTSETEIAVCNLGSVNLSRHIKEGKLDEELFRKTIGTAMRMLDNVIDLNYYLVEETKNSNLKHRPVGLGMMGFQDALFQLNLAYSSPQTLQFADEVTEKYSYYAILTSSQLAQERGVYSSYLGSKWEKGIFPLDTLDLLEKERGEKIDLERKERMDWNELRQQVRQHGMRNSNTMAIAPNATTSNIAGCYPCIEPIYSNLYNESNAFGEFCIENKYLVADLKKQGLWNQTTLDQIKYWGGSIQNIPSIPQFLKEKYRGAFELDPEWMIKITAHRRKWIDQSISHNVFYRGTSGKKISKIYFTAWELGLKTTYYLRTLGASQIEKSTLDINKFGTTQKRDIRQSRCSINKNDGDCESCQ